MRFIASLLLLLLIGAGAEASVVTTTINCKTGGDTVVNKVTQAAVNATENVVIIQVTPGYRVTAEVWSGTDWYYRSIGTDGTTHDSTTQEPVAASRVEKLCFTETTTFYHVRQTADGTLYIKPLLIEPNK